MVCTQQPDFSAAPSIQSMFPVNIAVAYLSEEKSIPESFVTDLRVAVSNCDTVAPIYWVAFWGGALLGFTVLFLCSSGWVASSSCSTYLLPVQSTGNPSARSSHTRSSKRTAAPPRLKNQRLEQAPHSRAPSLVQSLHPTRRWARLQPASHCHSRHRMDVVPLVALTVRCLVTRQDRQMVGSFLVRVPNQRHPACGSGDRVTVVCAVTVVLYDIPVTRHNGVLRCLCRYH